MSIHQVSSERKATSVKLPTSLTESAGCISDTAAKTKGTKHSESNTRRVVSIRLMTSPMTSPPVDERDAA